MSNTGRPDYDRQIEEILEFFDFEKVRTAMTALDWKYYDSNETPTRGRIISTAVRLLHEVARNKESTCFHSTGGFLASKSDGHLELAFQVETWSTHE